MALFKKKSEVEENGEATAAGTDATSGEAPEQSDGDFDPAKARKFFEHAQSMQDTANYEYAVILWLKGMRFDPADMNAFERFFDAAQAYMATPKTKGPSKGQRDEVGGRKPIDKYLGALLQWACKPIDWSAGLKAMDAAAKLELGEQMHWIGVKVLGMAQNDKKAKKDAFVQMMRIFAAGGVYELAVKAGDTACRADPTDGKLANEVKNMSAQATMSRGGYEGTGAAGGFRANIKDAQAQRELIEEESVVKSAETMDRVVARALADFKERPEDQNALGKAARVLLERGKDDDEKMAFNLLMKGYEQHDVYKFKRQADEIRMRRLRRQLLPLREQARADGADAELKAKYEAGKKKMVDMETEIFAERVQNYPTDLAMKYELGRRYFEAGRFEEAIGQFQKAQGASGIGNRVRNYLAQSFSAMGWLDEAEDTYREAVQNHPVDNDELGMELRYGLMDVLARKAEDTKSVETAKEAFKIASSIAIQQINYKDIRERREKLQALVKALQ
ncbi:MAG: tetratricopeptide repeat protein [Phycisphaerales bacterium]|nr:tetratricopeptide repeat protein [Phycisphaerales bacterium]